MLPASFTSLLMNCRALIKHIYFKKRQGNVLSVYFPDCGRKTNPKLSICGVIIEQPLQAASQPLLSLGTT